MKTLISHYSDTHFLLRFPSSILKINSNPTSYFHRKCRLNPPNRVSCTANSGSSYNGWDDLKILVDSDELGESNHIKKLLFYLGIDDRKYVFTCMLGFVIALVISRVRVSAIVVFPAAVIVFAIGFSFGFVSGGPNYKGFGSNVGKRREIDEFLGVYVKKLKNLGEMFDGFDVKVSELKSVVEKAIDDERVDLSELESYVNILESIGGLVLDARNVVKDCSFELQEEEKKLNKTSSRNKKEIGNSGFNLLGFFGSFLRDYGTDSNGRKRNVFRRDSVSKHVDNRLQRDTRDVVVEQAFDSVSTINGSAPKVTKNSGGRKNNLDRRNQEMERILQSDEMSIMEDHVNMKSTLDDINGEFNYQSMRFVDNQRFSFNMSSQREYRKWSIENNLSSYTDFDFTMEHQECENSWSSSGNSAGAYKSTESFGNCKDSFGQGRLNVEDELHTRKYQPQTKKDTDPFSSSTISDELLFDNYLTRANDLLKEAKECLKVGSVEIFVEEILHESAKLLSLAVSMRPMSLLAIGQLGNTYLLHGELKLRTSRELRNRLSRNENFGLERHGDLLSSVNDALLNKDRISLRKTCEDCEALLVQAGRKYRTALSIDGNDLRALYNWGLALSFRAQLIADIGPEAAPDADKLFMAAIDKFDAMMSRSNAYAPEALFRWGMALQQRSRLRPSSSTDKVKLLQQAKRLYKDALDMGSENLQVRKALSSCMSELNVSDI